MKRSLEYTCKRTSANAALELGPGGSGWTKSQFNHTGHRSPGSFGLFHAEPDFYYYLDKDLVLDMTGIAPQIGTTSYDRLGDLHPERCPAHPDGPAMLLSTTGILLCSRILWSAFSKLCPRPTRR